MSKLSTSLGFKDFQCQKSENQVLFQNIFDKIKIQVLIQYLLNIASALVPWNSGISLALRPSNIILHLGEGRGEGGLVFCMKSARKESGGGGGVKSP